MSSPANFVRLSLIIPNIHTFCFSNCESISTGLPDGDGSRCVLALFQRTHNYNQFAQKYHHALLLNHY